MRHDHIDLIGSMAIAGVPGRPFAVSLFRAWPRQSSAPEFGMSPRRKPAPLERWQLGRRMVKGREK